MTKKNKIKKLEYKDIEFGMNGVLQASKDGISGKIGVFIGADIKNLSKLQDFIKHPDFKKRLTMAVLINCVSEPSIINHFIDMFEPNINNPN